MTRNWTVTLRIDTSAWSANREYPVTNVAGMGHAWLTVTAPNGHRVDFGYYPQHGGITGVGELRMGDTKHQPHQDAAYTYHVTADQASRILSAAERVQANPGWYDGLTHNCLTVARDLMVQGGVPMPPIMRNDGLNNVTAWKTGTPVGVHDPAGYNSVLRSTPEGQAARAEYEKSSELSGMKTDADLHALTHQAQAEYGSSIQLDPRESTYFGEVDSPNFLTDPRMSTVDATPHASLDAGVGWDGAPHADPALSHGGTWHADPAQLVNPTLSVDHHGPDWAGIPHTDAGQQPHGDPGWTPHPDHSDVPFDPGAAHPH